MNDSTEENALLSVATARGQQGLVVLAFANYAYVEVLLNWLIAMDRLGIGNYLIVSLDEQLHEFLSKREIPSVLSPLRGDLSKLWMKRIGVFRLLADRGVPFIHSDIDAVWLRNPISAYFAHPEQDLIISQGTIWPLDIVRTRGFVFCCGLFYLRSSTAAKRFLFELEDDVGHTGDDQITLNRVIESYDVSWEIDREQVYVLKCRGTPFLCSKRPIIGTSKTNGLKICLLPHHQFQRLHMPDGEPFVKHLLSPKTAENKLDVLRNTECLFLRPDWRDVHFDADSLANLTIAANS